MPELSLFKTDYYDMICSATNEMIRLDDDIMLETEDGDGRPYLSIYHSKDLRQQIENGPAIKFTVDIFYRDVCSIEKYVQLSTARPNDGIFSRAPLKHSFCQPYILKDDTYVKQQVLQAQADNFGMNFKIQVPEIESFMNGDEISFLFRFQLCGYEYKEETSLSDLCFTSLSQNLSADNVATTLQMAKVYNIPQLVNQCLTFMKLNANIMEKPNGDLVFTDNAEQIAKMKLCIRKEEEEESDDFDVDDYGFEDIEDGFDYWFEESTEEDE